MRDGDLFYDVLDCLEHVSTQQLQPEQALARLQPLRARYGDSSIELVWDDEAFDGSLHYDALIRPANANKTISLSVCPDDELPWALRGLQRWRDSELLRVNDVTMAVEQAITQLDVLWGQSGLMQRLIDSCIVTGELQRRDVQVTKAEIQSAFDGIRRRRGLFSTAALEAWLQECGMTLSSLEDMAHRQARLAKLRTAVVGADAESYLDAHREEFDDIKLAVLELSSEADAHRAIDMLREGTTTLVEVAQHLFVVAGMRAVGVSFRHDARHVLASEFDGCELKHATVHMQARGEQFVIAQVLAIEAAHTSPITLERVKQKLFQDWLAAQRRTARIEWFWGDAELTRASAT